MNQSDINLSNLTDKQKSLLTSLSYLDIDNTKYSELLNQNENITISDLSEILTDGGNKKYLGSVAQIITGIDTTEGELISE